MRKLLQWVCLAVLTLCIVAAPGLGWSAASQQAAGVLQSTAETEQLEQQARSQFAAGDFAAAASSFGRVAAAYQTAGALLKAALALSNVSLSYQQTGDWTDARTAVAQSLALLDGIDRTSEAERSARAQALDIQASLELALGQVGEALTHWEQSAQIYQELDQRDRLWASQLNQAQALQALGLYRRAIAKLLALLEVLHSQPDSLTQAIAWRSLGDALRVTGNLVGDERRWARMDNSDPSPFSQSRQALTQSLQIAQRLENSEAIAAAHLSLGHTARLQTDRATALDNYRQAATAPALLTQLQAQVSQFTLQVEAGERTAAQALVLPIETQLAALPLSRSRLSAQLNFAESLAKLPGNAEPWLLSAVEQAAQLPDPRIRSAAVGQLGSWYEQQQRWDAAEQQTNQALLLAQSLDAGEMLYRWQWQLGRILKAKGDLPSAIAAYQGAVDTIKSLRADLATVNPEVQLSFRDTIEPIHRQLVSLLLQAQTPDLQTARDVIESLQLVELDNFFREACLNANPELIDRVDRRAAVIYPIILEDRLAVIFSLPQAEGRSLQAYTTPIAQAQLETLATNLREDLDQPNTLSLTLPLLQQLYDWLLRPGEDWLRSSEVETLVFVPDGVLRNLPLAALHDGEQFLIQTYSVALTPGLQLLDPRPIARERLRALVAGLTEARQGFSALPNVTPEVSTIESEIPSQVLLDRQFTSASFQASVESAPYPIVHLATHGQFSSNLEQTFILTWDGRINVNQLSDVLRATDLRQPGTLELLVFSACETAAGDDRAALGLAGVAVRAGARSTIATLWQVSDESSAVLMGQLYAELTKASETGITKAEALRRAQLALLQDPKYQQEPYFWAAYVLVGNWL